MGTPEIDPEARPDRARAVRAARAAFAAFCVLLAVLAAVWLAFGGDPGGEGPPVLTAETTPERLPPAPGEQGGAVIPHKDQTVYEITGRDGANEKPGLAPRAEAPVSPPRITLDDPVVTPSGPVQLLPPNPAPDRIDPPRIGVTIAPAAPPSPSGAPALTAPPPSDPPIAAASQPGGERAFPPRRPADLSSAPAPAAPAPSAAPPQQASLPSATSIATPAPAPPPAPAARTPAPPALPPASTFRIQIAAVRDKAAAQREWRRISQQNADILGSLQLFIQEVNITGKGVFMRVQAGPLPDKTLAEIACSQLQSRNQDCIVVAK